MDVTGKRFPSLVHETCTFIEEALSALIDDDPVRIDQHHRRGSATAGIDRLDMHAIPVTGHFRAGIPADADSIAGVEARSRRDQPDGFRARAELLAHHRRIALKAPGREDDGGSLGHRRRTIVLKHNGADTTLRHEETLRRSLIANSYAGRFCRIREFFDDRGATTDGLDAFRSRAEVIGRRGKCDAAGLQPTDGVHGIRRKRVEIVPIGPAAGRALHVVFKFRPDAIGRIHPDVRRAPAGVAARFLLRSFLQQRNLDAQVTAARLFRR